jgi:hypothetical protein
LRLFHAAPAAAVVVLTNLASKSMAKPDLRMHLQETSESSKLQLASAIAANRGT